MRLRYFRQCINLINETTEEFFLKYFRRRFWRALGIKIGRSMPGYDVIIPVISGLTLGFLFTYMSKTSYNVQTNDNGVKPKSDENSNERENVWYKKDYELTTFDVTPTTTSYKGLSYEIFINKISKNIAVFTFERGVSMKRVARSICVSGQIYMTNNHCVPEEENQMVRFVQQSSSDGVNKNLRFNLSSSQIHRFPERDICFIVLNNLPPKKNIIDLFPKSTLDARMNGSYIKRDEDGSISVTTVSKISKVSKFSIKQLGISTEIWKGTSEYATKIGDCGSVMIAQSSLGPVILGIHVLGGSNDVCSLFVDHAFVHSFVNANDFDIQCGEPSLSSVTAQRSLGSLHKKATVRFIQEGTASTYGSFKDFRGKPKSTVCLTPIVKELSPLGYKIKYTQPEMLSWEPWRIALLEMVDPVTMLDQNILDECTNSFKMDILNNLSQERLNQIEIYDNFTAVNGAPGVAYVDKINRSTSAGNPWKKSKKYFLESIPAEHGLQDPVKVSEEIMDRVAHIISEYEDGKTTMPNFCAHLKDEPVSFKKAKMKKTRVFTGAPFDWSIVVRKYLLSVIRVLQNERYIFEAAPGTVAQSLEWQEMYGYLTKHGENRMVAGDYKSFDKKMPPQIILAAYDIIYAICEKSGNYSDLDLKVVRGIAYDTAFPLVDFNGDLMQFYGSNPSGHPLTVIINSLVNSLYMRYCYKVLNPESEVATFKSNVSLMTYGDDNIMGVSSKIQWFNHTSIQATLKDIGIVYTMADKEAASVPYLNISETSFLKRSWRYDIDIGAYVCPLEHESIEKMLMVWTRSKTITEEEQICSVVSSAVREYFYYGKEIFNEKRSMLQSVLLGKGYELWIEDSTFPTWDELYTQFWDASKNVDVNSQM
jgi:hypothetical protein